MRDDAQQSSRPYSTRGPYTNFCEVCTAGASKMSIENESEHGTDVNRDRPRKLRLPGFISEEDIGLGDAIKRATSLLGIPPCSGCEGRAAKLNRRLVFSKRR